MKFYLYAFITIGLLTLTNCSDTEEADGLIFDESAYNSNRELWEENQISDYTFSQEYFSTSIGGQPKLTTIIINNELDSIFASTDNNIPVDNLVYYDKINDIYDFIEYITESCEEQINSSESPMEGATIYVEYDETFNYPTEIRCSGRFPNGYDGGLSLGILIDSFEVNQ